MAEELLKCCPFCGGHAQLFSDNYRKYGVYCTNCKVILGVDLECGDELIDGWKATFDGFREAITAWNTRK